MFEKLITDVKSLNLPAGGYALFGSAPIIVRGIREASHDIDIVVKQNVWDEYKGKPGWITRPMQDGDEYLEWEDHNIELWRTWGPGEWDVDQIIDEAEMIDGLAYVQLQTVLDWKKRNGRPKDLKDIALIKEYLKNN